ncbi:EamA family transporter [Cohnella sp. WQ 127256]|uniref:EamA family transporter n=1 Tax=Cohnella sp. WQ 127256 TaxID=2938790 RepID=UPI002117F6E4|nr:EamA family transporter [Cohnella sp. WQ 127256]
MLALSILFVICSGLTHAVWNMLAKQSASKQLFLWVILVPTTVALLPHLIWDLMHSSLPAEAIILIGLSLLLQSGYAILLSKSYEIGDMSQVYPIMRGTSTLLIPLIGVIFLNESLSVWGWGGLLFILSGIFLMSARKIGGKSSPITLKPVLLALGVGLTTTAYILVDKINLTYLSPLALLEISNIGFMLGLTPFIGSVARVKEMIQKKWRVILVGSILSPGSYLLFLVAMYYVPVARIAPIREVGTVFGTLLGIFMLKESEGTRRLVSACIIATGIVAIGMWG